MKLAGVLVLASAAASLGAFQGPADGVPAHMVVTVEAHRDKGAVPELQHGDVSVQQGHERMRVSELVPLRGDRAGLEFFVLIDDSLGTSFGNQLADLKKFIEAQPAKTRVGVAYLRNGTAMVLQNLTPDHAQAAKALRLPIGSAGAGGNAFISLTDLIKRWPAVAERREVLMVSSGLDLYYGPGPQNPYLQTAIEEAQKAGVIVYTIYYNSAGHFGHNFWGINWGQNNLGELADETGGEFYWQGLANPVSLQPYLEDLRRKLDNQYLLTFYAKPGKKPGLETVKVHTEVPGVDLLSPARVFVPIG